MASNEEGQQPLLHKPYDKEHYVEMLHMSNYEDRKEYYPNGILKRKLQLVFCKVENKYSVLETNYNEDGSLLDVAKGYTFRYIYDNKTVGHYKNT